MMKHILYFLNWCWPTYIFSWVSNLGITGYFAWHYYEMHLPMPTPRLLLLYWIVSMAVICVFIYMFENGVAKLHYAGRNDYPLIMTIVNQIAAAFVYVVVAFLCNFNGLMYFPSIYLSFVIKEFNYNIINNSNEEIWTIVLMLIHTLIFVVVGMVSYLRERKRLVDKYNRAMSNRLVDN